MAQLGGRRNRRVQLKPADETAAEMQQQMHEIKMREKYVLLEREFENALLQEAIEHGTHTPGETQVSAASARTRLIYH